MTESLALRYRPATFQDLAGQPAVQVVLYRMVHYEVAPRQWAPRPAHQVPHGLLFSGTRGSGKTSAARIVGAALNCLAPGIRPCGECESCLAVRAGTSLAVVEVDAASNGTVDQVRRIQELVSYDCGAVCRVVILDEVHSMSRDAFNALLKLLEEPPPDTIFVLVTTEPGKVLPTVASRCMPFHFQRIAPAVIARRLQRICDQERIAAEPALLAHLAEQADGALRDAVNLLDQAARGGVLTLDSYSKLHGLFDFAPSLVAAMVKGDRAGLFAQVDRLASEVGDYSLISSRLVGCLRDLLVLQSGGTVAVTGRSLAARQELAGQVSAWQVAKVMKVLWELRTKTRASDARSSLELAVVMCAEVLSPTPEPPPRAANGHTNGSVGERATVEDFRQMAAR